MTSMSAPPQSGDEITDETLINHAVDMILSLLSCIRGEDIKPRKHWTWAQKALKTGAMRGTDWRRMVSEMYAQLPIRDAIWKSQCRRIYSIGEWLESSRTFRRFRYLCKTQAPAIIMIARVRKEQAKADVADERSEHWMPGPDELNLTEQ